MKAVGIDLAGVESRPTGLCLMDGNLHASTCLLYTDDEITRKTVECRPEQKVELQGKGMEQPSGIDYAKWKLKMSPYRLDLLGTDDNELYTKFFALIWELVD